jgi:hypothetical protein
MEGESFIPESNVSLDFKKEIRTKPIILMCIFIALANGMFWWDWVLEPWIFSMYGPSGASLMTNVLMFTIVVSIIGAIVAYKVHNKVVEKGNREKVLAIIMIIAGTLYGIGIFLDLLSFLILVLIVNLFAGMYEILIFSLMMKLSKEKASLFQFMAVFRIIARITFVPLGLYLYAFIPAQVVILIGCSMLILSAVPMLLIPRYKNKE